MGWSLSVGGEEDSSPDSAQLLIVLLTDSHLSDACPSVNIWEEAAEEETADRM